VRGEFFNPAQEAPRLRLEDSNGVVWAGKTLHRIERIKEVDHDKFGFVGAVATQDMAATIALDGLQSRQNLFL